jgi:GPH family glycoside/pentoside/hexuronide:cation symporter
MTKLSIPKKMAFGICDLGGNAYFTLIGFSLLFFLTDIVNLNPLLAGIAIAIGRVWDAITDPMMGYISDRTRTRWGRRRIYMFFGAIFLFVCMILLWIKPFFDDQIMMFWWFTFVYCAANTAYTMINIPYGALTPEMTPDFDERTSINAYRMVFAVLGTFTATIGVNMILSGMEASFGVAGSWALMGLIMGAIFTLTALITVFGIKERDNREDKKPHQAGLSDFIKSYIAVLKTKPFIPMLIGWTCHITGVNILMGTILYFFERVYLNKDLVTPTMGGFLGAALVFIIVWRWVSRGLGKKQTYNLGMGIMVIALSIVFFIDPASGFLPILIMIIIGGAGFATQYIMPYAILPDIVEYDAIKNGVRREGEFYALWTFTSKLGQAFASLLIGWILNLVHYSQTPDTALVANAVKAMFSFGSAGFMILGIIAVSFYPISHAVYDKMMKDKDVSFIK